MAKTKHDSKVKQTVNKLKREGWKVKADIPGFEQPDPIGEGNYIPDVAAKKGGATKLIEIADEKDEARDKDQHSAFRRSAAHKKRTTFEIKKP